MLLYLFAFLSLLGLLASALVHLREIRYGSAFWMTFYAFPLCIFTAAIKTRRGRCLASSFPPPTPPPPPSTATAGGIL